MVIAVNEALIKQTADLMISSGLKDAGYTYLVIDGELMSSSILKAAATLTSR